MSSEGAAGINVTQLAGPGIPGMEDDTPLYHFDVPADQMAELIADPDAFLTRLGLRPARDRKYAKVNLRVLEASADAPDGGTSPEGGTTLPEGGMPHSCCYFSGESEMTCHTHEH